MDLVFIAKILILAVFIAGIIIFFGKIKKKNKIVVAGLCVIAFISSFISDAIVNVIPMPKDTVQLTATGEKNPEALNNEVSLKAVIVDGIQYEIQNAVEGKWFWQGDNYMWRNENDSRKPDGVTPSVTLEVPKGNDRKFVFNNNQYRGIVEISCNGESKTHDLYSEIGVDVSIDFPGDGLMTAYMIKVGRLALYALFIALILAYFVFAALKFDYNVIKGWFGRNWDKVFYAVIAILYVILMQKYSTEGSFWGDEIWQLGWIYSEFPDGSSLFSDSLFKIWFNIMPYGQENLLLLSQLFVAGSIYVSGLIGSKYKDKMFGVLFSSSIAFSLTIIDQCSMEIRPYAMLLFATSVMVYAFLKKQKNVGNEKISVLFLYGFTLAICMDSHPFGLVVSGLFILFDFLLIILKKASKKAWLEFIIPGIYGVIWLVRNFTLLKATINNYSFAPEGNIQRFFDILHWLFEYNDILFSLFIFGTVAIIIKSIVQIKNHDFNFRDNYTEFVLACVPILLSFLACFYSIAINPNNSLLYDRYFISIILCLCFVMCYAIYFIIDFIAHFRKNKKIQIYLLVFVVCNLCIYNWTRISPWSTWTGYGRTFNTNNKAAVEYVMAQNDIYKKSVCFVLDYANDCHNYGIQYYTTQKGKHDDINHILSRNLVENIDKYDTLYICYNYHGYYKRNNRLLKILNDEFELVSDNKSAKVKKYIRKS